MTDDHETASDIVDWLTVDLLGLIESIEEVREAHCCGLRAGLDDPLRRARVAYDRAVEALVLLREAE